MVCPRVVNPQSPGHPVVLHFSNLDIVFPKSKISLWSTAAINNKMKWGKEGQREEPEHNTTARTSSHQKWSPKLYTTKHRQSVDTAHHPSVHAVETTHWKRLINDKTWPLRHSTKPDAWRTFNNCSYLWRWVKRKKRRIRIMNWLLYFLCVGAARFHLAT